MDNAVDNIIDLGLVNYVKHPTNPDYVVFRFADSGRANSFEDELKKENITFEKGEEQKKTTTFFLFGIHKRDFKRTLKMNYLVEAKHKKPLIPFKAFRYFLILVSTAAMTLAIMGYCERQKKLASHNNSDVSINSNN